MRKLTPDPSWPDSWRSTYQYDLVEVWGARSNLGQTYFYAERFRRSLRAIQDVAKPPCRVLDLAAAQGNFSVALSELGYDVVWNDLRDDMIGYVKLKDETGCVKFRPGNVFEFPEDDLYDVVFAGEVIEHVAHPDRLLRKLSSLIKPGGAIIFTTPNGRYFRNRLPRFSDCPDPSVFEAVQFKPDSDGHIFLLHPDEVYSLAAMAGLRVDRLELFANPLTSGHVKLGHLLPYLPASLVRNIEQWSSGGLRLSRFQAAMLAILKHGSDGTT